MLYGAVLEVCLFVFGGIVCVRLCVKSRCCGGGKLAVLCVESLRSEAVELSEFAKLIKGPSVCQ